MNHYFYDFPLYISPSPVIPAEHLTGLNEKKLLVVVHKSDFTNENNAFLTKILAAVKLDLQQDAHLLVLPSEKKYAANELMTCMGYERCIIFGVKAQDLGFTFETHIYQLFSIAAKQYLIGHPLEKIKSSTNYKKALWTALQQLFSA